MDREKQRLSAEDEGVREKGSGEGSRSEEGTERENENWLSDWLGLAEGVTRGD